MGGNEWTKKKNGYGAIVYGKDEDVDRLDKESQMCVQVVVKTSPGSV